MKNNNKALLTKALVELKKMQAKVRDLEEINTAEPIAIIGMSCRFPCDLSTPQALWEFLKNGNNAVSDIPSNRWPVDEWYDETPGTPGKMSTRKGYFINEVADFDHEFFNVSALEATTMDPSHRLLLETSWDALENAAIAPLSLRGSSAGVFLGVMNSDYTQLSTHYTESVSNYTVVGNGIGMSAGRLAHVLGSHGPAMAVDTLCSSSLVSVHLACQSLRAHETDLALAGGVNLMLTPSVYVMTSNAHMLSSDGLCKTFDESADGYARGEACGMVILKRLSDAKRDGDTISAIIKGSAVNQDGQSSSLPVPNGRAQEAVIRQALKNANLTPADIDYIEAHGTGTSLGDPMEIEALGKVFNNDHSSEKPLYVGSVKTNVGHTEGAAGISSLLKVIMMLKQKEIPPHLHLKTPNTHIPWSSLHIKIPTTLQRWTKDHGHHCAGVSSFGLGGTNAHVILQSVESEKMEIKQDEQTNHHLLTLSAKSPAALGVLAERYQSYLETSSDPLDSICYASNRGRSGLPYGIAVSGSSKKEISDAIATTLATSTSNARDKGRTKGGKEIPKVAFMFPAEGSEYRGMGQQLYQSQPLFKRAIDKYSVLYEEHMAVTLQELFWGEEYEKMSLTKYKQPALFVFQYALSTLLQSWGVKPGLLSGHGIGEYVAACVAGVFSVKDALKMLVARNQLATDLCEQGAMATLFSEQSSVVALMEEYGAKYPGKAGEIVIAAVNTDNNTVVSGTIEGVKSVISSAKEKGIESSELNISHAYQSPLIEPMLEAYETVCKTVTFKKPSIGIISNVSGQLVREELCSPAYWVRHTRRCVKFKKGLKSLTREKVTYYIEVGPGKTLIDLAVQASDSQSINTSCSLQNNKQEAQQMHETLCQLYNSGVPVDMERMVRGMKNEASNYPPVSLPRYPFKRNTFMLDVSNYQTKERTLIAGSGQDGNGSDDPRITEGKSTYIEGYDDDSISTSEKIKRIISQVNNLDANSISDDDVLVVDLDFDSMKIVELTNHLEKAFISSEKIPLKEIFTLETVADFVEFIEARIGVAVEA